MWRINEAVVKTRVRLSALVLAGQMGQMVFALSAAAGQPGGWDNLKKITWRRPYSFVDRAGNYIDGEIKAVNDQQVVVESWYWTNDHPSQWKPKTVIIERSNLLRITDGGGSPNFVYLAESSWIYVLELQNAPSLWSALVVTKAGKQHEGRIVEVSDVRLRLKRGNQVSEIMKADISQVFSVREKPISGRAEYGIQEFGNAEPHMLLHALHMVPMMSVLVYDSSMPEAHP